MNFDTKNVKALVLITVALIASIGVVFLVRQHFNKSPDPPSNAPGRVPNNLQMLCANNFDPRICCKCDAWDGSGTSPRGYEAAACRSGRCYGEPEPEPDRRRPHICPKCPSCPKCEECEECEECPRYCPTCPKYPYNRYY